MNPLVTNETQHSVKLGFLGMLEISSYNQLGIIGFQVTLQPLIYENLSIFSTKYLCSPR